MSFAAGLPVHDAGRAFDQIAGSYDEIFTRTLVGRAQRDAVWQATSSCRGASPTARRSAWASGFSN